MSKGERLFKFLASLVMRGFYGSVIIALESPKVMHLETETRRTWRCHDRPNETDKESTHQATEGGCAKVWLSTTPQLHLCRRGEM